MDTAFNEIKFNIERKNYTYIGSGSGRQVYDMRNGYVVKVAKNEAGIAQNKTEFQISYKDYSTLFAKVLYVSKDFKFLIMQRAYKIYNILYVWDYFHVTNKKELFKSKELVYIKRRYNLLLGDLSRSSSWGIINGKLVIVDYGFTKDVKDKYY